MSESLRTILRRALKRNDEPKGLSPSLMSREQLLGLCCQMESAIATLKEERDRLITQRDHLLLVVESDQLLREVEKVEGEANV